MIKILKPAIFLLLCAPLLCLGKPKKAAPEDAPDTQSLVTAVSVTGTGGTITVSGTDAPFVVDDNTTIMLDDQRVTINDVHEGMRVLSQTTPGSSMSEIDLKTVVAPEPPPTKKKAAPDAE
jgi:hypothetical protein